MHGLLLGPHLEVDGLLHVMQGVLYYVAEVFEISERFGEGWWLDAVGENY